MNKLRPTLCLILLASLVLSGGCGKTGNPEPRQATRSFVWQDVNVTPSGDCLDIQGVMSGVYSNLDTVLLELADPLEDCQGCPFVVTEQIQVPNLKSSFNRTRGELRFSHCPRVKAASYRLRLVGVSIFDTSRHAVSPVKSVEIPQ